MSAASNGHMKHIGSVLEDYLDELHAEADSDKGAPWLGDPWYFDVKCANCGHEYLNTMMLCPACDHEEVVPLEG